MIDKIREVTIAMEKNISVESTALGSSGSYFLKDLEGIIAGIFKPKDEEPYSILNPTWTKWVQRTLMPCCFGRGCLLIGQGYIAEAGAYLVDRYFEFGLVPPTNVVYLANPSFHYFPHDRPKVSTVQRVRENFHNVKKIGSFQTFVNGYMSSSSAIEKLRDESQELSPALVESFLHQFQRMVLLDYIIRNTDRNNDNWLVQFKTEEEKVRIAAIDNGLSFPYKHPDEWRAYPFHWYSLPWAATPFTDEIKKEFIPKLKNSDFIEKLITHLHELFSIDRNFDEHIFNKQMAVLRGQVLNLISILTADAKRSPQDLIAMPVMLVIKGSVPLTHMYQQDIFIGKMNETQPCFNCW